MEFPPGEVKCFRKVLQILITSLGKMFPTTNILAEVAMVIAAQCEFSIQNKIKTATRNH